MAESGLTPTPTNPVVENVLPQQSQQQVNINETYIKVLASNFGYLDSQDAGVGCWMDKLNNQQIVGGSLPIKTTKSLFGKQSAAKHKIIEIHNPLTSKTILAPLIDVGPGETIKYGLDLTYGAFTQLGGTLTLKNGHIVGGDHLSQVYYRVLSPEEQNQYKHLGSGMAGGQHNINAPMRSLQNHVDLVQGNNATRNQAIEQLTKGQVPDYPATVEDSSHSSQGEAGKETNVVHTPTNIVPSPVNTSGMPKGMFSVPEIGAMLWVFFRNGDPQFPVYFAASYGQAEWAQAYSASSPPLYYPGNDPKKLQKTDQSIMMPNKGGGMQFTESVSDTGNSRGMKIFGYSGAHLEFNEEHNIYYSPRDDYQQIDGHRFDIVKSNREMFTQGDSNIVTIGDQFIKIGNITKAALQAMDHINEAVNNINDKMAGKSGSEDGGKAAKSNGVAEQAARTESNSKFTKETEDANATPSTQDQEAAVDASNSENTESNPDSNDTATTSDNEYTSEDGSTTTTTTEDSVEVVNNDNNDVTVTAVNPDDGYLHEQTYPEANLSNEESSAASEYSGDYTEPSQTLEVNDSGSVVDMYEDSVTPVADTDTDTSTPTETVTVTQPDGTVVTKTVDSVETSDTVTTGGGSVITTRPIYDEYPPGSGEKVLRHPGSTTVVNADGERVVTHIDGVATGAPPPPPITRVESAESRPLNTENINNEKYLTNNPSVAAEIEPRLTPEQSTSLKDRTNSDFSSESNSNARSIDQSEVDERNQRRQDYANQIRAELSLGEKPMENMSRAEQKAYRTEYERRTGEYPPDFAP